MGFGKFVYSYFIRDSLLFFVFFFDNETFRCLIEFTTLYSVARQLAGDEIHEIFADVDSDKSDLSLDRDEGTEGESDSEVIMPGHEISQTEPALVESDDVVVPFDRVVKNPGFLKKKTAHAGCFIN